MGKQPVGITVIGGGNGISSLLYALKPLTTESQDPHIHLTAIVSVADDGGSTGRLRHQTGCPAPGDLRRCLMALQDTRTQFGQVLYETVGHRFGNGNSAVSEHSVGNVLITALWRRYDGDLSTAVREASLIMDIKGGCVIPATSNSVSLCATSPDGAILRGESLIGQNARGIGRSVRISLSPNSKADSAACSAIRTADIVLVGPGSLYTSLLPALLPMGMAEALRSSNAYRVLLCNPRTQQGETDRVTAADELEILGEHLGPNLFNAAVVNTKLPDGSPTVFGNGAMTHGNFSVGDSERFAQHRCFPIKGRWITNNDEGFDASRLHELIRFLILERADLLQRDAIPANEYAEYKTGQNKIYFSR